MYKSFLDNILLFKVGRIARTLFIKEREIREKQKESIGSSEIPSGYENKNSIDDVRALEEAFRQYENLNNVDGKFTWTWFPLYIVIIKTFKRLYGIYFLLFLANLAISYFVKFQAKEFFDFFISENSSKPKWTNLFPGLFLVVLQIFSIVFTTHCEYYNSWIHHKIRSAISGSSLLRFIECKRLKNKQSLCILDNNSSTEVLSLYQNIILVDSEFTEFAVSNSINVLLYPLHIIISAIVAHSVFGGTPLILCLLALITCFSMSAITQYISSMYKRPFLKAREERVEETTRIIEQSKYLSVTHQLFFSIQQIISKYRRDELYYNSLRKYICMVSEVFDNWITLSCTLAIGSYILYNKLPASQASLMIIQSVWLIPTFYHPLNDIIFFIYFIVEGKISMERIAQFLFFTQNDPKHHNNQYQPLLTPLTNSSHNLKISNITLHNLNFSRGKNIAPSVLNINLNLYPGTPCFVLGQISSGKSALLEGIAGFLFNNTACQDRHAYGVGAGGKICMTLEDGTTEDLFDISSRVIVGYVPQFLWIPSGLPLSDLVLCGGSYDEKLWREVIYQCDLELDFLNWGIHSFEDAKRQVVTDKHFSAGQKVRLSLARVIYSNLSGGRDGRPRIFLIDGVLNSLDPFVCRMVIERIFSKKGLLADSMSIIVIEPPILEFVRQASSNAGFSYKVINMSDKMITKMEDITMDSVLSSPENMSSSVDDFNEGKPSHCEIEKLSLNHFQKNKGLGNGRNETVSKIDIQKTKFSYYYPTNYFYMFIAGSRKEANLPPTPHSRSSACKFSWFSNMEPLVMMLMLVLPPIIVKLGESFFLIILKEDSATEFLGWHEKNPMVFLETSKVGGWKSLLFRIPSLLGYNALSFWCSFYISALIISMISICVALLLELRIGFRAAKYFHNSILLSYLGATSNSILRWLPLSFILNRLSNDQLHIDYCITRRIRSVIIILNSVFISSIPLIFGSINSLFTLAIIFLTGISIYYFFIRYFINGCRTLRSCFISEYSPLVDIIQTIGKGKKCLTSSEIRSFFFETSIERIDSVLKPIFTQISLDAWFKMRIKILLTVPITLINILLPFVSDKHDSSTKSILALAIATVTGLAPLLSILVGYWTKLEAELVSVERSRLYLAASREAGMDYLLGLKEESNKENAEQETEIKLENVEAKHIRIESQGNSNFDNSHFIGTRVIHSTSLRGITAKFKAGEIVGIVGRTGSGKTTLLDILSNLILSANGKITISGANHKEENIHNRLARLGFLFEDFDPVILKSVIEFQQNLSHIALLPLEMYFPKNGNIRDIVDPFKEFDLENIKAALNICGFGSYLTKDKDSNCEPNIICNHEEHCPLLCNENNDAISNFLETKLDDIRFGILQMRMLLFVNFFLKRDQLRILLVDEPPVVLRDHAKDNKPLSGITTRESEKDSTGSGCLLSSIINQYFKHCITFVVSHDIRSLQYINRIIVLSNGKLIKDSQFDKSSLSNSELYNFVKTNMD